MERRRKAARTSTSLLTERRRCTACSGTPEDGATGSNFDLKWMAGKDQYRLFHWTNLPGGDYGETCRAPGLGASDAAASCADPSLALCGNSGGDPERAASQRTAFTDNTRPRSSIRECTRDGGCSLCKVCRR